MQRFKSARSAQPSRPISESPSWSITVGGGEGLARALPTALMTLAARLDELPSEVVLDRLAS
jgi:hypothetical protein